MTGLGEGWLGAQLERFSAAPRSLAAIDIGGFVGDFTAETLAIDGIGSCTVFEPNPTSFDALAARFKGEPRVSVVPLALGSSPAQATLRSTDQPATGSLLPYSDPEAKLVQELEIEVTTLDAWIAQAPSELPVALLKVDAQGFDLEVLRGARKTVGRHRPLVAVELIWADLYEGQARPQEILGWLEAQEYAPVAIYGEHYGREGWLSWCDAAFLPRERIGAHTGPWTARLDPSGLEATIANLERVCAERLELIDRLSREAAERLAIIERLERQLVD